MMNPTEALDRLHRAGWSVGETANARGWLVTGSNGGNLIHARGRTQSDAWTRAAQQAAAVGMLALPRPDNTDE